MKYLIILFLFTSCSKAIETPSVQKANALLESPYLVKQLEGAVLTITMEPVVIEF